jgi:hypothetical protein
MSTAALCDQMNHDLDIGMGIGWGYGEPNDRQGRNVDKVIANETYL